MKILVLMLAILCSLIIISLTNNLSEDLKVINYTNSEKLTRKNGTVQTKSSTFKIVYYKDYTLYSVPAVRLDIVPTINVKDTTYNLVPIDTTIAYYVIKNGSKYGLKYDSSKYVRTFSEDSLSKSLGIHSSQQQLFSYDMGKPLVVIRNKKTKELELEKYVFPRKADYDPDSVYKYYDKRLNGISFSFSPTLDKEKRSKLRKIRIIFLAFQNGDELVKLDISSEIQKTEPDNKRELLKYFDRAMHESQNLKPD